MTVIDDVRYVAGLARDVSVDETAIKNFVTTLDQNAELYQRWEESPGHYVSQNPEKQLLYVLALNSINFCFWTAHDRERQGFEYVDMAKTLKAAMERGEWNVESLGSINPDKLNQWVERVTDRLAD
eukprot:GHVN01020163.1.p1 GENE.GHVN01020163.1~~GHVN01020163.1.p1  ORF type:complete len:126 (-),score=12.94 GHVN01020163.1:3541-3918(-)